jgi:hypothetical protein
LLADCYLALGIKILGRLLICGTVALSGIVSNIGRQWVRPPVRGKNGNRGSTVIGPNNAITMLIAITVEKARAGRVSPNYAATIADHHFARMTSGGYLRHCIFDRRGHSDSGTASDDPPHKQSFVGEHWISLLVSCVRCARP